MKMKQKTSLADKIADILTSAPTHSDPEDDADPQTAAKISHDVEIEHDESEELLSKFRRQNVDLLADVDERYAGKRTNRKGVHDSEESSESDDQDMASSDSNVEENVDSDESNENVHSDDEGEETDEDDNQELESSNDDYEETEDTFKHMRDSDMSMQVKKGVCVRNQLNTWENLLEMRIQLQKCLVAANKMPPNDKYQEIKKDFGQEFSEKVSETKTSLGNLLDKLMVLQNLVQKKYPETKKLKKNKRENGKGDKSESEDEEIASDTDEDIEESENDDDNIAKKKRKLLPEYEKDIATNFELYKSYRNDVIQKWHKKTRLTMMKSNAASQSIVAHIEHTLSDKVKLLKRTQLRRSDYKIIGENIEGQTSENSENNSRITQIYNTEIFDDDDFYHQLLRELIEVKSADMTDPVQLGRQWIQLQNLRSKMKRKIDTKATKGRKIRYTVHAKLVNFMAGIDETNWTDEAKNELYTSLFGKKQLLGC